MGGLSGGGTGPPRAFARARRGALVLLDLTDLSSFTRPLHHWGALAAAIAYYTNLQLGPKDEGTSLRPLTNLIYRLINAIIERVNTLFQHRMEVGPRYFRPTKRIVVITGLSACHFTGTQLLTS
jgi:hypothetical protein